MSELDFETRLGGQLRTYAQAGVRPIDRYAIAASIVADRRTSRRVAWSPILRPAVLLPLLVALLLLALVAGAIVIASRPMDAQRGPHVLITNGGTVSCLDLVSIDIQTKETRRLIECANRLAFTADGRRAAAGGAGGLKIVDLRDGTQTGFVDAAGSTAFPIAWSPGGRWLQWATEAYEVVVGDPDGTVRTHLPTPTGGGYYGSFKWSADDRRFSLWADTSVLLGDGDGTHLRTTDLTSEPWAFSPDGSRIAYGTTRAEGGNTVAEDLIVADTDGAHLQNLTRYSAGTFAIGGSWSPDGQTIVTIVETRGGDGSLPGRVKPAGRVWLIALDGSARQVALPADLAAVENRDWARAIRWSPDGTRFVVESGTSFPPGSSGPASTVDTYIVPVDGSGVVVLKDASMAAWSPDGRALAVVGGSGASATTDVVDVDGTNRRTIGAAPSGDWGQILWTP